jgi:hypothetical protein
MKRKVEKKAVPLSEDILQTAKRRLSGRAARLELEDQMQTKDALSRRSERETSGPARKKSRHTHGPTGQPLSTGRIKGSSNTRPRCSPGYFTLFWLAQGSGFNPCFFTLKKLGNFFLGKVNFFNFKIKILTQLGNSNYLGFLFRKLKQEFFQLYLYNYQTTIIPTK